VEIRELRVYLAVVEEGGLTAAARRLHQSQSSVSETVRSLERQLGVVLLERSRAGARETEAGRRLTAGARRLVRQHDRLTAEVAATAEVSGVVRLGVPLELPAEYLPQAIATVAREHPGIEILAQHASTTAQWAALRSGALDIGLVRELVPGEEYDAALVVEDRLGVLLAAHRARELAAADGSIELHRLAGLAWNGFARSDTPASYDNVAAVLRAHGIRVPEPGDDQRPITPEVKLAAVADGSRFALALPDFPVTSGVSWHRLAGDPVRRRTWAVWRADAVRRDLAVVVAALEAAAA
jgi:DNA-binding transcriptional LysR family regulator